MTIPSTCPRCGAAKFLDREYACMTQVIEDGQLREAPKCLKAQLDWLEKRIRDLSEAGICLHNELIVARSKLAMLGHSEPLPGDHAIGYWIMVNGH